MSKIDWNSKLNELIKGFDLGNKLDKEKAFMVCFQYAKEKIQDKGEANEFLRYAQQKIGFEAGIHFDYLKNAHPSGKAKIHVCITGESNMVEVTANEEGWLHLANICKELAKAGEHEHTMYFRDEPPLVSSSLSLTLYKELDPWLKQREK